MSSLNLSTKFEQYKDKPIFDRTTESRFSTYTKQLTAYLHQFYTENDEIYAREWSWNPEKITEDLAKFLYTRPVYHSHNSDNIEFLLKTLYLADDYRLFKNCLNSTIDHITDNYAINIIMDRYNLSENDANMALKTIHGNIYAKYPGNDWSYLLKRIVDVTQSAADLYCVNIQHISDIGRNVPDEIIPKNDELWQTIQHTPDYDYSTEKGYYEVCVLHPEKYEQIDDLYDYYLVFDAINFEELIVGTPQLSIFNGESEDDNISLHIPIKNPYDETEKLVLLIEDNFRYGKSYRVISPTIEKDYKELSKIHRHIKINPCCIKDYIVKNLFHREDNSFYHNLYRTLSLTNHYDRLITLDEETISKISKEVDALDNLN